MTTPCPLCRRMPPSDAREISLTIQASTYTVDGAALMRHPAAALCVGQISFMWGGFSLWARREVDDADDSGYGHDLCFTSRAGAAMPRSGVLARRAR